MVQHGEASSRHEMTLNRVMTARTRGDIGGNLGEAVRGFRISSAWKSVVLLIA